MPSTGQTQVIPTSAFRKEVETLSGEKPSACFQCQKCSNGCPLTFGMDIAPHQVIRDINLGIKDEVLNSDTIWVCASCETCTTRCPNGIDIAHIMDSLRQISVRKGVKPSEKQTPIFHTAFLASVERFGRVHEASMALEFAAKSEGIRGIRKQAGLGLEMFRKGKIKIIPGRLRAGKEVDDIFRTAKRKWL
jgi:heterodisulfide reductase subunit C